MTKASKSSSDKSALKTERFQKIFSALKPSEEKKTMARVKILLYLHGLMSPFLTMFQSQKPQIHNLYTEAATLFEAVCKVIMVPDAFTKMVQDEDYTTLDVFARDKALPAMKCSNLISVIKEELSGLSKEASKQLLIDIKWAWKVMIEYLQSHLPLDNVFLKHLSCLHPSVRTAWTGYNSPHLPSRMMEVARRLKRFSEEELVTLEVEVALYQNLSTVPCFNEREDRLDTHWVAVWELMKKEDSRQVKVLPKLVKMCLTLPHSQAWVERGFSLSKRIAENRESLSIETMKSLKTVTGEIKRQGGAENVLITSPMMNSVKMAGMQARKKRSEEKEAGEKRAATEAEEAQIAKKRKIEEETKKNWTDKKKELESELESLQKYVDNKEKVIEELHHKAAKCNDPYKIKGYVTSMRLATEDLKKRKDAERSVQAKLHTHMSRKQAYMSRSKESQEVPGPSGMSSRRSNPSGGDGGQEGRGDTSSLDSESD